MSKEKTLELVTDRQNFFGNHVSLSCHIDNGPKKMLGIHIHSEPEESSGVYISKEQVEELITFLNKYKK